MRTVSEASSIEVRSYRGQDASAILTVSVEAITETAAADYSPTQDSSPAQIAAGHASHIFSWPQACR